MPSPPRYVTMRRCFAFAIALVPGVSLADDAAQIGIAKWILSRPAHYSITASKSEPTYLEAIDIDRSGDAFSVKGGAPAWAERSVEAISVSAEGELRHDVCPKAMTCGDVPPSGFLATTAVLAAARAGSDLGYASPVPFGTRSVVCVPSEKIGIANPILDPCLDVETGAVLAQRHRRTGAFDGPSLDPWSVRVRIEDRPAS